MRITLIIFFIIFGAFSKLNAQQDSSAGHLFYATVIDGDTVPVVFMNPYSVWEQRVFKSKREEKKYNRLQRYVKIVYPYAKKANELLAKYEAEIAAEENPRERKKYYKKVEEELLAEYGADMKEMTTSQGRILIKLIDRETERTSYELVKEFRSGVTAFFWQGIAKLFSQDLKSEYDANTEDKYIEDIVVAIEQGRY
ncbi:MAG: DUF4294 domain-containing protein [Bacteroidetes bacterium]|jgi:hypothetical protein|nr:hypothetical protein [Crocinitomicaceae bacterium]MCH9823451.1 DUF4294 domain-containing protein [Bacteroidota bacterium]|tara:strand:- start:89 stop:679 length:591 start_codon:yes stop_codon:yes gene_type:complete